MGFLRCKEYTIFYVIFRLPEITRDYPRLPGSQNVYFVSKNKTLPTFWEPGM